MPCRCTVRVCGHDGDSAGKQAKSASEGLRCDAHTGGTSSTPVKKVCGGTKSQNPVTSPALSATKRTRVGAGADTGAVHSDGTASLEFLDQILRRMSVDLHQPSVGESLSGRRARVPWIGVSGCGEDGD